MKPTTIPVAAGLVALLSVSCGGHSPQVKTAPGGIGLSVRTLDRGAEPRERLRYAITPGRTDVFALEIELAGLVETRAGAATVEAPILELGVQMGPATAIDDYTRAYAIRFRAINVRMPAGTTPEQALEVQREVAPLAALAGTFQVDSRGLTQRAELTVPDDLSPRLMTLLGNIRTSLLTIPLPDESVGVGARWEVQRALDVGGVHVRQTVTYTLVERVDDLIRVGVTLNQTAVPQQVTLDDQGTKLAVEAYEVSTVGSSILKLDHLAPLGEARGTSELRGVVSRGSQIEPVAIRGVASFRMVPLANEAMTSAPLSGPAPVTPPTPTSPAPTTNPAPSTNPAPMTNPSSTP